MIRSRSLL